jgi:hypothetical protein
MGHKVNYAKPGNELPFYAKYNAVVKAWQVLKKNGEVLPEQFATYSAACAVVGWRNKEAALASKQKERACMTCRTLFASEGPHNRMCNRCRQVGSAECDPVGYSFGAMSGRRRA